MTIKNQKMADHSVDKIMGIGKITAIALKNYNITTVKQLAECEPETVKIVNINTLVHRAKDYLYAAEGNKLPEEPVKFKLNGVSKSVKSEMPELFTAKSAPTPVDEKAQPKAEIVKTPRKEENKEEEESKYLITDHSWWEMKVLIPRSLGLESDDQSEVEYGLREAIIYELSIEPHDRIAFMCSWIVSQDEKSEKKKEQLCSMTYSPQLLLYFNLDLPPLDISIRPEDYEKLPNKHTLTNVLWEMTLMHKFAKLEM
jgi:hypothetical protein